MKQISLETIYDYFLNSISDFHSRVKNIKESVVTAKEAVSLDVTDGKSWCKLYLFI